MDFRILGPLEVRGERGAVAFVEIKPRAVLAVLLLHPNQPVSAERLALALLGRDLVVPLAVAQALTGLAAVAAADARLERAARLAGAGAAHRSRIPDDPVAAKLDATFLEPARTRFGADAWDAAFGEGAALNIDVAIVRGLERPPPRRGCASQLPVVAGPDH